MPTNHEAYTAIEPGDGRDILVRRIIYPIIGSEDPTDFIAIDPDSGLRPWGLAYNGYIFWLDPLDTTTAHDGVTTIRTFDNLRYKRTVGDPPVAVESKGFSNPTLALVYGVAGEWFIVGPAATGAWSGHTDDLAFLTAAGTWVFVTPGVGVTVYVKDEDSTYHVNTAGDWVIGIGANALAAGSVLPSQLKGGGGRENWIVENQTTNTPPGTVTEGIAYIIGSSPTGAWAGNALKIAHGENGAWVLYTPSEGWRAWDKATDGFYHHNGTTWVSSTGQMVLKRTVFTATGANTFTKDARSVFADVHVIGGTGGANPTGSTPSNGGTSSFGAHCSATGSTGSRGGATISTPGTGSSGDVNVTGAAARDFNVDISTVSTHIAIPGNQATAFGVFPGAYAETGVSTPPSAASSGPGYSRKRILAASIGATETVTVGAGGSGNVGGVTGGNGKVIVDEWILT